MKEKQLLALRLQNQQLLNPQFKNVGDVVSWMGAVQAQDYYGALWAIGLRMKNTVEAEIEKALDEKKMVRSWPMRGTLHFTSPQDLRWMLKYLAVRVKPRMASVHRKAGLDEKIFTKSKKLWEKALLSEIEFTREELYAVLERSRIHTGDTRGLHILVEAAHSGLICFGSRRGKQQTLRLLDEWISATEPMISKEEAMARLATLYIQSHGPVLVEDLAWWSGLNKTEAQRAIESISAKLSSVKFDGKVFWFFEPESSIKISKNRTWLLPTYDEFGMAYKDRSLIISDDNMRKAGGFFIAPIINDGKVTGLWRRTLDKNEVAIEKKSFRKFSAAEDKSLKVALKAYGKFIGREPKLK